MMLYQFQAILALLFFIPVPNTVVEADRSCASKISTDTMQSRIPATITEIICHSPGSRCGGRNNYSCRQFRAKMVVDYTRGGENGAVLELHAANKRNITINTGCKCILRRTIIPVDWISRHYMSQYMPLPQRHVVRAN